ncbi:MAG TPA: hypothetical protein ENN87_05625 [Phycisphaerales bacterium]|nr:hypothetical protein [Phycisphaerales bacterium]
MDRHSRISSAFLDGLTEAQRQAVCHVDGPLLVLAGPGSGKTRVITHRIVALTRKGVPPYHLCAITFTNKAAEEMRQRVLAMGLRRGVHISTFHSLCVRILRQYAEAAGLRPNFSIYDDSDQKRVMKEALAAAKVDTSRFQPARMLAAVGRCKNDLEDVDSVAERADDFYTKALAQAYRAYQARLAANNAVDFDDLLVKTAFLLRDHPEIRQVLSDRYRYLLVDEYQDTNHAQYQIAKGLALAHRNLCVTGDPDQSIYRWRGADIENILVFEKDWPDAVVVKLEENFRSRPHILQCADRLIAFNQRRKAKTLIPTREPAETAVVVHNADDEYSEAEFVADAVAERLAQGVDPGQVAVFYRVNAMSRPVEEALIRRRLPYQVVRGVEFYNRKEIRDMLAYLKVVANPDDNVAFLRAVGTHPRGIGKTTLDRLQTWAEKHGLSLDAAARRAGKADVLPSAARSKLAAFAAMIEGFRAEVEGPVAPLMERVFEESGYAVYLAAAGTKEESAIENVEELINAAALYDRTVETPSLADWLQTIALYSDTDAYESGSGKVSLMTLHAAKGLEFDNVFIVGLEEGLLPHERSMDDPEQMEEERRLLFVGITRAREHLVLVYSRYRTIHGQFLATAPSPFLYELGYTGQEEEDFDREPAVDDGGDLPTKAAPRKEPAFRKNQRVQHPKFGRGRVEQFIDLGADSIVVVRFGSGGTKTLLSRYAKLEAVAD